jgi:dihydrofolate synthase / folylpolyglutamate synthase
MNYLQTERFIEKLNVKYKGFTPEKTGRMLEAEKVDLGKSILIHVAGTNGKGSVCAMIESILCEAGCTTGLYISPHLVKMTERIRINKKSISKKIFAKKTSELKNIIKKNKASYFEALTLIAAKIFEEKKVEVIILETGLGGRLDATNAFETNVQAITGISKEHEQFLGKTIHKIAFEKAGIIKKNGIVAVSKKNKGYSTIKKMIQKNNALEINPITEFISLDETGTKFNSITPIAMKNAKTNLIGTHQSENAEIALAVIHALKKKFKIKITNNAIKKGLMHVHWPARTQVLSKKPLIILDGAHNPRGVKKLFETIKHLKYQKLICVFGCLKTKNLEEMSKQVFADEIIAVKFNHKKAVSGTAIEKAVKKNGKTKNVQTEKNVSYALKKAGKLAKKNDLILVFGSLYLAGELLKPI